MENQSRLPFKSTKASLDSVFESKKSEEMMLRRRNSLPSPEISPRRPRSKPAPVLDALGGASDNPFLRSLKQQRPIVNISQLARAPDGLEVPRSPTCDRSDEPLSPTVDRDVSPTPTQPRRRTTPKRAAKEKTSPSPWKEAKEKSSPKPWEEDNPFIETDADRRKRSQWVPGASAAGSRHLLEQVFRGKKRTYDVTLEEYFKEFDDEPFADAVPKLLFPNSPATPQPTEIPSTPKRQPRKKADVEKREPLVTGLPTPRATGKRAKRAS